MHRYYFKSFAYVAMALLLSFLILGVSFVGIGRAVTLNQRKETLVTNAEELGKLYSAYIGSGDLSDLDMRILLSVVSNTTGTHCVICDEDGKVVACSDAALSCHHIGRVIGIQVLDQFKGGEVRARRSTLDGFYGDSWYVAGIEIFDGDTCEGYLFSAMDVAELLTVWATLNRIFAISALLIFAVALFISFWYAKWTAKPINQMASAAVKYAHGDFSARVQVDRDDEIGALADAFNNMADYLENSERRRSEFLANVAHELKTPMTTISGFADGLLDGTIPKDNADQYLETISSETKRLNRLVRRMLVTAQSQQIGTEELLKKSFDAAELLMQTLLVFESKINAKHLDVNAFMPEDCVMVRGDSDAINQVIYNLLENAVKFSPEKGELGVSIFRQERKAYISIKNQGPTIPENELKLVFDRFHKTDKSRSMDRDGVGLGLYIVRDILRSHGEDIVVTSRDGVTEFVFSLTLVEGK